jgi:hypothetical protein
MAQTNNTNPKHKDEMIVMKKLVENATSLGEIHGVIHAAGVSPSQASPETFLKVDLYGTALVLEEFGMVIAEGGAGVVIASQSGHRLPSLSAEQDTALATTPVEELLKLPMLQPDKIKDSLRLSAFKARQFTTGHVRGGLLGQARRTGQHDQPRHNYHPACEG